VEFWDWFTRYGSDVGFGGLVTFFVYLVFTGRIVARSVVDDIRSDAKDRLEAKERVAQGYREAWETERARGLIQDAQVVELLEHSRTAVHILESLPRPGQHA
jgi:hypothetical protein